MTTTPDLDRLRQLAVSATSGPWASASGFEHATDCTLSEADADFIAAASPDVVLSLLDGQAAPDPRNEMAASLLAFLLELESKAKRLGLSDPGQGHRRRHRDHRTRDLPMNLDDPALDSILLAACRERGIRCSADLGSASKRVIKLPELPPNSALVRMFRQYIEMRLSCGAHP